LLLYTFNEIRFDDTLRFYICVEHLPKDVLSSIKTIRFDKTIKYGTRFHRYVAGLSRIKMLPNLEKVVITSPQSRDDVAFSECARRFGGKWKLVLGDNSFE
jgi:hypothetical protein